MNFEYALINDQLYLSRTNLNEDFSFLGFGFTHSPRKLKPLREILSELDDEIALGLLLVEASRYPNSSRFEELKKIKPDFIFSPKEELVFFGGSFNPWHEGHKACLDLLAPKKSIILPDRNPFKDVTTHSPLEVYLKISSQLDPSIHYLNPEFILQTEKNPTYYWIKTTRERFPHIKMGLLMGMDSFESILSWHKASDLLSLIDSLYVASRLEDESLKSEMKSKLSSYPNLSVHYLGHHDFESVSSTALRRKK